ncbi:hypothetical protein [Enterococcus durans]|uniref:hypothetical protein n=1 Tax=Enterococcus durans TaxID=53345 RepID=UPI0021C4692C|nr:hypothetical protein [Enterococcus durans]
MRNELEFVIPETSLEFVEVDGRSADIIFDKGKYNDIEKVFPVRVYKEKDRTIAMQLREIAAWLYLDKVYSPLIISEYDEYYYQALGYSEISAKDKKRNWLDIDFIFKCQPFGLMANIAVLGWEDKFPMWLIKWLEDEIEVKKEKYFPTNHLRGDDENE